MPGSRRRQPRAGAREGDLAPALRAALREEVGRLTALEEPADRVRAVGDTFAALDRELARIAEVRLRAIVALRREGGWSYDRLAAVSGLSKSRIAQLCREANVGG